MDTLITKLYLDEGDTVTPSGAFTKSKDRPDVTLIYRLSLDAMIGPILSFLALEFDSLYGLDLLIPDLRDVRQTVWITACFGKELFCRQKGSDGTVKRRRTNRKSHCVPLLLVHRVFLFTLGETPCLTLAESPCKLKSNHEFGKWHLVLTVLVKTPKPESSGVKNCHEEDGARSWTTDMWRGLSVQLVGSIDKIHGQMYETCWDPRTAGGTAMLNSDYPPQSKTTRGPGTQEPKFNRIASRSKASSTALPKSSLISYR